MGWKNWSVRMQDADFSRADREYLEWALGQASLDLSNGYAQGKPVIRKAAKKVREKILAELEKR